MILHCKNAEMAIYCHFCISTVQDHTIFFIFHFFFFNLAVFYIGGNKKKSKINYFFFSKMQKFGSEDP